MVTHIFTFTNTGDNPLILDKCKGSCGCTVPQCPKEPIAPLAPPERLKSNSIQGQEEQADEDGHHQCQHRPEEDLNHHFGQRHPRPGGWHRQVIEHHAMKKGPLRRAFSFQQHQTSLQQPVDGIGQFAIAVGDDVTGIMGVEFDAHIAELIVEDRVMPLLFGEATQVMKVKAS